jgi:hypothetical protein
MYDTLELHNSGRCSRVKGKLKIGDNDRSIAGTLSFLSGGVLETFAWARNLRHMQLVRALEARNSGEGLALGATQMSLHSKLFVNKSV